MKRDPWDSQNAFYKPNFFVKFKFFEKKVAQCWKILPHSAQVFSLIMVKTLISHRGHPYDSQNGFPHLKKISKSWKNMLENVYSKKFVRLVAWYWKVLRGALCSQNALFLLKIEKDSNYLILPNSLKWGTLWALFYLCKHKKLVQCRTRTHKFLLLRPTISLRWRTDPLSKKQQNHEVQKDNNPTLFV